MRLAEDEIEIRIAGEALHLRPSLRAAYRLERRHGGFEKLARAIADENVTVMADVLREGAYGYSNIPNLIEAFEGKPLRHGLEALTRPLLNFVFMLAGVDGTERADEDASPRVTFAEHHERLFRIGTGWLGWSANDVWNATPAEIEAAYQGRLEMLRAIFGVETKDDPKAQLHAEPDPSGIAKLKWLTAIGANKAAR